MHLFIVLQQPWPKLLLQLLLLELQLDVLGGVRDLALGWVDLPVELELDGIVALQAVAVAAEVDGGGLQIELEVGFLDVWDGDGQVDEVLGGFGCVGALSPEDCRLY